jgi:hypothetical protein
MFLVLPSLLACIGGELSWSLSEPVDAVDVTFANGDIVVLGEDRNDIVVNWSGGGLGFDTAPNVYAEDGVGVVDGECHQCGGALEVRVPLGVAVTAELRNGNVSVHLDEAADIDACVLHGAVDIEVPAGAYALALDGVIGAVSLRDIVDDPQAENSIAACVGAGDIEIRGR